MTGPYRPRRVLRAAVATARVCDATRCDETLKERTWRGAEAAHHCVRDQLERSRDPGGIGDRSGYLVRGCSGLAERDAAEVGQRDDLADAVRSAGRRSLGDPLGRRDVERL